MKDFIYKKENSIDPETCNKIIELFEKYEKYQYPGVIGSNENSNTRVDIKTKNTIDMGILSVRHVDEKWEYFSKLLINNLKSNLEEYNLSLKKIFSIDIDKIFWNSSIHSLLIHKYKKNEGKFTYHNDMFLEKENFKYRVLNYMWYLNDVDQGGETEFFGYHIIKPKQGTFIFFPSEWFFPHTGKVALSNDKYVITGWIYIDV